MNQDDLAAKVIELESLLAILQALRLADCDPRALGIVAQATGLGAYWATRPTIEIIEPLRLEQGQR